MIDYTKILLVYVDTERLENILDFKLEVIERTGEYSTKKTAEYHFCNITIHDSGIVLFSGSIHKLWNSINDVKAPNYLNVKNYKGYNGNQFTMNNILMVRKYLEELFDCKAHQMIFQNIEFGINTTPLFNPQLFIKGLLYHKGKLFEYRFNDQFAMAIHQRYYLKIYNKSNQYGMKQNTLRIEFKCIKMEEIKELGIKTFDDINTLTLNKAKELIIKRFDEVVYYDNTIRKENPTERIKLDLVRYSNPRFWIDVLKPQHRDRHKKRLLNFIVNYSDNLRFKIKQDIIQKCVIINRLTNSSKCVINNYSNIELNNTQSTHLKCIITGISLEREKEGAKFIRTSTIRYLRQNDKSTFIKLSSMLLSNTSGRRPKFEDNIISHLAKQIRNRYYNQMTIRQTGYRHKQYQNQLELSF